MEFMATVGFGAIFLFTLWLLIGDKSPISKDVARANKLTQVILLILFFVIMIFFAFLASD